MPFERRNTRDRDFHLIDGGIVQVPMMTIVQEELKYDENSELGCKMLHLPYEGDDLTMVIILPTEVDGLLEVETRIDSQALLKIIDDVFFRRVEVYLPKFKLESSFALSKTLSALGMVDAFSRDEADLSGMGTDLYVSNVFHKAFVDVNEKGSEAAAATAAAVIERCPPPRPRKFKADHPFLFLIWDFKLRVPLFIGRNSQPMVTKLYVTCHNDNKQLNCCCSSISVDDPVCLLGRNATE
ncbi:ANT3-like protein [Mya arenaria]|uniref:ANT3-like protein n=1 Tax=Mya arenaria TaxID=6604 RepID=A0ABY7DXV8_MYAAR|nr:ANT3-like protein [Mya arenaria]